MLNILRYRTQTRALFLLFNGFLFDPPCKDARLTEETWCLNSPKPTDTRTFISQAVDMSGQNIRRPAWMQWFFYEWMQYAQVRSSPSDAIATQWTAGLEICQSSTLCARQSSTNRAGYSQQRIRQSTTVTTKKTLSLERSDTLGAEPGSHLGVLKTHSRTTKQIIHENVKRHRIRSA